MNLQFYFEKLLNSEDFMNFKKANPRAFLCSGFFAIDKEGKDNKQHFDFFVPETKKVFSFQIEEDCSKRELERLGEEKEMEKISDNVDFDLDYLEKLIEGEMFEQNVKNKIQKILLSLQRMNGKDFFIGTIFVSGLGIIKMNIDIDEKKVTDFEKKSFFDMLKIKKKGED